MELQAKANSQIQTAPAEQEHGVGSPFQIGHHRRFHRLFVGRRAAALWRTPCQSNPGLPELINRRSLAARQIRSVPAHAFTEADWR
jgi:hypothetical protein